MNDARRKVVVVGAGSGIGAAVATHFHNRGDVVLADRKPVGSPDKTSTLTPGSSPR